jgi:hypothetical protein
VFAAVFDALCVLAVPPLTFGVTVIVGWMVIIGSTLTTFAAIAMLLFRAWARCPDVIAIGVAARE